MHFMYVKVFILESFYKGVSNAYYAPFTGDLLLHFLLGFEIVILRVFPLH